MTDSSGMKIYHTPNKRPYDAGYILWGSTTLTIPMGKKSYVESGACESECTEAFNTESIFINEIIPHMHYYGEKLLYSVIVKYQRFELFRFTTNMP